MKRLGVTIISLSFILVLLFVAVSAHAVDLMAGQHYNVGNVNAWVSSGILYVQFEITDPDWSLTETHVDVVDNKDDFEKAPGQFLQGEDHDPPVGSYTHKFDLADYDWGSEIFIAAHAVVCKADEGVMTALTGDLPCGFPAHLEQIAGNDDPCTETGSIDEVILYGPPPFNGTFPGWCVQKGTDLPTGTQSVCLKSTYDLPGWGPVNYILNNVDNYLNNQSNGFLDDQVGLAWIENGGVKYYFGDPGDPDSNKICEWHIQWAIWLQDGATSQGIGEWNIMPPEDQVKVQAILKDVEANGSDYEPGCGDVLGIIIVESFQNLIIPMRIKCECEGQCETAWAISWEDYILVNEDNCKNGKIWGAMYFPYTVTTTVSTVSSVYTQTEGEDEEHENNGKKPPKKPKK